MRFEHPEPVQFITFSCADKYPFFEPDWAKDIAVDYLAKNHDALGFQLYSWSIMDDHMHLLLQMDPSIARLSTFLSSYKTRVSKKVLALTPGKSAPLWEPGGGYMRSAMSKSSFLSTVDYIENNPVEAGLVRTPEEYRWSSAGSKILGRDAW